MAVTPDQRPRQGPFAEPLAFGYKEARGIIGSGPRSGSRCSVDALAREQRTQCGAGAHRVRQPSIEPPSAALTCLLEYLRMVGNTRSFCRPCGTRQTALCETQ
jgi:hypothetical protein